MNSVILMGRLVRDPELRQTPGGVMTSSFTLAVDRGYTSQNGERQADFINCVSWRQTAEFICNYFKKGQMMAVEGSLQVRSWTDNSGGKRYATEVVVSRAHFCGSKESNSVQREESTPPADEPIGVLGLSEDDLPF